MNGSELRVVPRPRDVTTTGEAVTLDPPFGVGTVSSGTAVVTELLESMLARETNEEVVRSEDPDVRLTLSENPSPEFDSAVGYRLDADADGISITAASVDGLRHGCQTLVGGLELQDGQWTFPAGEIHDWPASDWRGFMLDPARGHLSVDRVKRRIDQVARAKMNRLHLHLLDDEGYALESDAFPELNEGPDGATLPAYSTEEVKELVDYAAEQGVEIVPEIDVPSHVNHLVERYPELRCTVPDGEASDKTLCLGSERAMAVVKQLLEEVVEQFPFEFVHVGGDEWEMHGHSWDECVECREQMHEDGSASVTEHFYAFVRRLHEFLESHDREVVLWNDQIDVSESPDLPRDALVQFWRVAAEGRGPVEGCSMDRFAEEGFDLLNSYVYAAYVNGWITEDAMYGWKPRARPSVSEEHADQVRGGELLAWEPSDEPTREYFERALPSAIPVFADRLWNGDAIESRSTFSKQLTRHALGPFVPREFDVYEELGGTILPNNWKEDTFPPADLDRSLGDRTPHEAVADYHDAAEMLGSLRADGEVVYPETAAAYEECLEWLIEAAELDARGVMDRPGP